MKKHLFLTGGKQVGKSTLLRALLRAANAQYSGFETRPLLIDGLRRGFYLHGFVPLAPEENDCIFSVRLGLRQSVPVLETFEQNGVALLEKSLASPAPYLLMDEIGKHEQNAPRFLKAIHDCLDSEKRVLGVLQQGDYPLFAQLQNREDVQIITVTAQNRDALLPDLLAFL